MRVETTQEYRDRRRLELTIDDITSAIARLDRTMVKNTGNAQAALRAALRHTEALWITVKL